MSFAKLCSSGVLALAFAAWLGPVREAAAQATSQVENSTAQAENVAAARSLGIEGVELAEAGKCDQAIEKLSRAESLYHAPTILDRLGECQIAVGQIVLGTENLNRVVREPLAANAPKAFRDAQERAKKALEAALPRIAHLTVNVEPEDVKLTLLVSGVPVPAALIGVERPTDPGTHEVVASAPGYVTQRTTVTLAEGGHEALNLHLTLDPNAAKAAVVAPAATAVAPPPPVAPPPAETSSGTRTLSYILVGAGAVGIAVGGVTGAVALGKKNNLDCPQNQCAGGEADELRSAKGMALASTISFAVGIPAAAIGTVLLITTRKSQQRAAKVPARHFAAEPYFGPTGAGFLGSFW
jgi:hypothetical protein